MIKKHVIISFDLYVVLGISLRNTHLFLLELESVGFFSLISVNFVDR